jgi:Tfp pilus assembly protein PilO
MSRILIPLALLISSAGLVFSYIKPTYGVLTQYQALNDRLTVAQENLKTFESKRDQLTQQYSQIREADLKKLERMIPDKVNAVQTIIDIDALAQVNSIRIGSFALPSGDSASGASDPNVSQSNYASESFGLELAGGYQNFKNFLAGLESSLVIMDVTQLSLDANESSEGAVGEYKYQVSFNVYKHTLNY